MSHYDTLRVVPWAEDDVIRAAYRALMRIYHPDTNADPEAQLRAREITRAFSVLGDPEKRAAYDALPRLGDANVLEPECFEAGERSRPPLRNVGIASVALALVVTLGVAVWPQLGPRPLQGPGGAAVKSNGTSLIAARTVAVAHVNVARPKTEPVVSRNPQPDRAPDRPKDRTPPGPRREEATQTVAAKVPASKPMPKREIAQAVAPKPPVSMPIAGDRVSSSTSESDNRQAEVERQATSFLKQSMEHADWHKQELLLSARNRSAYSRAMCRSSDCVTETYLRQIRETTEIMQGRIPNP